MNETMITRATFGMIEQDMRVKQACGVRMPNPKMMLTDYKGCVTNMVNVFYRDIAVGLEVETENPLNTREVTSNIRSYLKSVLNAKYMCAPRGRAQMVQFVNQDQCLRDVVRMAQAKWTVRMTMQRGDWYNALMGMSTVFKQLTAVEQQCRLVRRGYRRRYLASYTCESSTLYAQAAGV